LIYGQIGGGGKDYTWALKAKTKCIFVIYIPDVRITDFMQVPIKLLLKSRHLRRKEDKRSISLHLILAYFLDVVDNFFPVQMVQK